MKVKLKKGQSALSQDIEHLEREIGNTLPTPYSEFIRQFDGAVPDTNVFHIGSVNNSGINKFIPIHEVLSQRLYIENLSSSAFPIAWAEGGNYVVIDGVTGTVYFWDHERPTPLFELATDFGAFMEILEPFDTSSIKLKPGQVKRAWIDPDFLRSLKERGET